MRLFFIIIICLGCCSGVIYHLNDTEYERMPNLIHFYPYEKCLRDPGALYCTAWFQLVSDTPSPLLNMIEEYTEHTSQHFNHTRILQGVCVQRQCKDYVTNTSEDLREQLEGCMNKSFWEEYQLKTKAIGELSCNNESVVDMADLVVAVIFFGLILLNVLGTLYDVIFTSGNASDVSIEFLICFSVRRNIRRLLKDPLKGSDPRLRQLKGLNGLRTISTVLVILAHSLATSFFMENSHYLEKLYFNPLIQLLVNRTLIMQTFFIMSGLLLVYHSCLYIETHEHNWKMLLKGYFMRWLRLTPAYAVVLAFTTTWMRHLGSGPFWNIIVKVEVYDCRQYWWWHLIYLSNYLDNSNCMIQSWYLAVDMQLFCIGITIFILCQSKKSRTAVLSVLFVIGVIIPALHTYYQDLDGIFKITPETARGFFIIDDTFNHIYKRGHTNLLGYVVGWTLGYLLYYWQDIEVDLKKYKKYRPLYWCAFPLLLATIYSGSIFYGDRPRLSLLFRTFYLVLVKPVFCLTLTVIILGVVFKYENLYRSILEWEGWTVPSKVCYSAYLLHVGLLKCLAGIQTSIETASIVYQMNTFLGLLVITFAAAYPFWLLVETPLNLIVKTIFMKKTSAKEEILELKTEKIEVRL